VASALIVVLLVASTRFLGFSEHSLEDRALFLVPVELQHRSITGNIHFDDDGPSDKITAPPVRGGGARAKPFYLEVDVLSQSARGPGQIVAADYTGLRLPCARAETSLSDHGMVGTGNFRVHSAP
jgi:hypothetical protein